MIMPGFDVAVAWAAIWQISLQILSGNRMATSARECSTLPKAKAKAKPKAKPKAMPRQKSLWQRQRQRHWPYAKTKAKEKATGKTQNM